MKLSVTGSIEWQNTIGGNNDDYLQSIQQTTDGGYILGGSSYSGISGDKTESNQGMYDYWIVKLFATGVIQWQNTIGGNDYDQLQSLQQTTNGGYVVGGSSYSGISGDKTSDNKGGLDFWVVGLNANGAIQWQKNIGGSEDDNLATIKQTVDGGYILGGTSKSGISNQKTENSQGLNDYWIIKISSIGEIQWQNTIGGSGEDFLIDIHQTIDGTYMVGGYSSSGTSGDKTAPNMGSEDYWILKLSSLGIIQWQNTIGGNHSDKLSHIQQTTDGGYIMGGDSNSPISGNKTEGNQGGSDYWVMKFTSVNDNPLAVDFSLPTTNCVSEPLTFTNNSNGNTYQWLIDGLFVSNDADLNYSFAQPGAYTITLIGANSICNDTSTRIFNIAAPSTINYSSSVNGSTV
ncbi:MAG TPA: hypothetical protein PKH93_03370, partial [Chitinophagales bacterium]|nr:hypothetical protein [Chitinophagales bacterium]